MTKVKLSNLNELKKYVDSKVKKTLINEVAPHVKERLQDHVDSDVYIYEPKKYHRTGQLRDEIDIVETEVGVKVFPTRSEYDRNIPEIIETGKGYMYSGYGYDYEHPRPFAQNTKEELKKKRTHVVKMKQGLQKQGLKVK